MPGEGHDTVRGPVSLPGRSAFEQLPVALANDRVSQHRQQSLVELLQIRVGGLGRTTTQVRRNPCPASLELSLMEEPQTWRQERDDSRRLVHAWWKRRGPRLVVVFEKTGHLVPVIESGVEMLAHGPRVP